MHRQVVPVGVLDDRSDLVDRVPRTELGALGDRDDLGLRPVLIAPTSRLQLDQLGSELALRRRHREQLEPADTLGRTALVDVDVRGLGADDGIPALGHRLQRDDVGAGPIEDRICHGVSTKMLPEDPLQMLGVDVGTVGNLVSAVGPHDGLQDLGVDARVVVAGDTFALLGRSGLLSLPYAEEHGGGGQPYEVYLQVVEEIASAWMSVAVGVSVHSLTCFPVAEYGSDQQRADLLPVMLSGQTLGAYCLSEPQAGSDVS